jgi:exopolysaccharide production protein ExoZ
MPLTSGMATQPKHYAFIDALRGYALLGVMSVHVAQHAHIAKSFGKIARSGQFGVQLFFVVSAITLMMSWNARKDGVKSFYLRRLFRIAPMFWLAIPFYQAIGHTGLPSHVPDEIPWWHFAATAFFAHGFHPATMNEVVPGGWSIAVEMTFYLIFPILAAALTTWKRAALAAALSLALPFLSNFLADGIYEPGGALTGLKEYWFVNQFPVFLIGIAAYHAIGKWHIRSLAAHACVLIAAAFLFLIFPSNKSFLPHIQCALAFAVLAFGLAKGGAPFVVNKPIIFLGKISYSGYLTHFAALALCIWTLPNANFLTLFAGTLAITAVASWACYGLIEKPFIALGQSLIHYWKTLPLPDREGQAQLITK